MLRLWNYLAYKYTINLPSRVSRYHGRVLSTVLISMMLVVFIMPAYASSDAYDSGRDHGCDDARISDPSDRYINQPEKGPSFHTGAFMDGYNAGFSACSTSSSGSSGGGNGGHYDDDDDEGWNDSCRDAGFKDGQDHPFNHATYDHCGDEQGGADAYYDGFIDGCMSVEGNTRDVCESATDR